MTDRIKNTMLAFISVFPVSLSPFQSVLSCVSCYCPASDVRKVHKFIYVLTPIVNRISGTHILPLISWNTSFVVAVLKYCISYRVFYVYGCLDQSFLAAIYNLKTETPISIGTKLVSRQKNTHICLLIYIDNIFKTIWWYCKFHKMERCYGTDSLLQRLQNSWALAKFFLNVLENRICTSNWSEQFLILNVRESIWCRNTWPLV